MVGWPRVFLERMQALMNADEFEAYLQSNLEVPHSGLRVNSLKINKMDWQIRAAIDWDPIDWCADGFYIDGDVRWGKQADHAAGLYYLQEPSAMAAVELLDVQPGMRVLDLCAAPGGKTTQLAAKLQGQGVLVCNDPHPERVKALTRNVERCIPFPIVVMNELPERLSAVWRGWFDRILVDAPCSGEGMFRKDESIRAHWTADQPARDAEIQAKVLRAAFEMLKPGGRLVYSTCTYNALENETVLARFLADEEHASVFQQGTAIELLKQTAHAQLESGRSVWIEDAGLRDGAIRSGLDQSMVRIWPHRARGEGHTLAVLEKQCLDSTASKMESVDYQASRRIEHKKSAYSAISAEAKPAFQQFLSDTLIDRQVSIWTERIDHALQSNDYLYWKSEYLPYMTGLKVYRTGFFLGELSGKKPPKRFVPSTSLALSLRAADVLRAVDLSRNADELQKYLKGETLDAESLNWCFGTALESKRGWVLVCVEGFGLGWARSSGDGYLKNDYPPGWRWQA